MGNGVHIQPEQNESTKSNRNEGVRKMSADEFEQKYMQICHKPIKIQNDTELLINLSIKEDNKLLEEIWDKKKFQKQNNIILIGINEAKVDNVNMFLEQSIPNNQMQLFGFVKLLNYFG